MSAQVFAFPDERDPVGSLERLQRETGRVAIPLGGVRVRLDVPKADRPTNVTPFRPARDFIPAFLRLGAPRFPTTDPDGPQAA